MPYIVLPADSMTLFNPDNYHLLITGAGPMHDGKDIMLRLTFANAAMQADFSRAMTGYDGFHGTNYAAALPRNRALPAEG